jgi:ABC-2 type transport system permease protein
MKRTGTIIKFEYLTYVKAKSFIITTAVLVVLILVLSNLPNFSSLFAGKGGNIIGGDTKAVVLLGDEVKDGPAAQIFSKNSLAEIAKDTEWVDGNAKSLAQGDLKKLVKEGEYDAAFYYNGGVNYEFYATGSNLSVYAPMETLDVLVTEAAKQEAMADVPDDIRANVSNISAIAAKGEFISIGGDAGDNFWICYIFSIFLYMVLVMYGNFVTSSVVTEKTSKTMELLITAAKPIELMFGKVLGVGLAGLTQVGTIVAAVVVGLFFNLEKWKDFQPSVFKLITESNLSISPVVFLIIMFILGYFFYAFIYAGLGSTVSKPEEAATVTVLPMILLVLGFILSIWSFSLNKSIVAVLSYIPPFTPFVMMNRYAMGDAGIMSMVIGLAVLFAAVLLAAWVAAKIYRVGVMMYGKPMGLVTLIKTVMR